MTDAKAIFVFANAYSCNQNVIKPYSEKMIYYVTKLIYNTWIEWTLKCSHWHVGVGCWYVPVYHINTTGLPMSYKLGPRSNAVITRPDFKSEAIFGFLSPNYTGKCA